MKLLKFHIPGIFQMYCMLHFGMEVILEFNGGSYTCMNSSSLIGSLCRQMVIKVHTKMYVVKQLFLIKTCFSSLWYIIDIRHSTICVHISTIARWALFIIIYFGIILYIICQLYLQVMSWCPLWRTYYKQRNYLDSEYIVPLRLK